MDIPVFQTVNNDDTPYKFQSAALCFRLKKEKPEVLLVTSRDTGRWIIPKGWFMVGLAPHESAEREAYEEAGIKGRIYNECLGAYTYQKVLDPMTIAHCQVLVFPLKVKQELDKFPEKGERRRKWFSAKKAATLVNEPDLAMILKSFRPGKLKR